MSLEESSIDTLPPYILNWKELTVSLAKGRFKHFIGRPTKKLLLERDAEIKMETPLSKNGGYAANAGEAEQEAIDAKYCRQLQLRDPEGYSSEIDADERQEHEATVWNAMYERNIYIPEEVDIFGDVIPVYEDIGNDPDNPKHRIIHKINKPKRDDLKKMRNAIFGGRYEPDKRGRQKFVTPSYLQKAVAFYDMYLDGQDGSAIEKVVTPATEGVEEKTELIFCSEETRQQFIDETDLLIKRTIVVTLVKELKSSLRD